MPLKVIAQLTFLIGWSGVCVLTCVQHFATPWTVAGTIHGIFWSRTQEWDAILPPGDLPDLGLKPVSLASPALAGRFLTTVTLGRPSLS